MSYSSYSAAQLGDPSSAVVGAYYDGNTADPNFGDQQQMAQFQHLSFQIAAYLLPV
jgi:hypothetical protein